MHVHKLCGVGLGTGWASRASSWFRSACRTCASDNDDERLLYTLFIILYTVIFLHDQLSALCSVTGRPFPVQFPGQSARVPHTFCSATFS